MTDNFREKCIVFRDTRDHQEHDAKNRLLIPGPSSEKPVAEIHQLKKKPTLEQISLPISGNGLSPESPSCRHDLIVSDLWTVKSAVHFIKKNYEKAIFSTTEAIDLESSFPSILKNKNNVLIRRADSFSRINEFESAKLDLDLVDEPNEGQMKKMRIISKRIRELTKKNDDKLAKGLSKMF